MADLTWIVLLIPAFPLLGFLANTFVIRREREAGLVASGAVVLSFVTALIATGVLAALPADVPRIDFIVWEWISIGTFRVPFGLLFDQLTAVMVLLVTGVGSLIHIYSIGYMHGDVRPVRYFAYLNLFIVAMLLLVMGDNLLLLFLGWEGVGLASFLLIGHWFDRKSVEPGIVPSLASVKAFVVNRIGDAGFLLAILLTFATFGSLSFYTQNLGGTDVIPGFLEQAEQFSFSQLNLGVFGTISAVAAIGFLMFIGVTGKSAQLPLFVWLPDAMAGPTPVSALIHAATMVTSGVYLLARNHNLFEIIPSQDSWVSGLIVAAGLFTALIGATAAIAQWDIKRVLAYSTVSQLGYMVVAAGMGAYGAAMFHLLTHGIFKALLFLAAGSVIHGAHDIQDMRHMGGLRKAMPTTFWTYVVGALALAGIFPLAGFWSKDEIIGHAWSEGSYVTAVFLIIASAMTAFYMGRQIALIFYGNQRDTAYHPHESTSIMTWPLVILAVGTIAGGLINIPGLHPLTTYLQPVISEEAESFNIALALVTLLASAGAGYLGWYLYAHIWEPRVRLGRNDPLFRYSGDLWRGAELAWGIDWFYDRAIARPYRVLANFMGTVVDQQGIQGILVEGLGRLVEQLSLLFRRAQTGYFRNYALVFLLGVIGIVGYFVLR
jgi:NADH-quinone oxidoreductase subunit L